MTICWTCIDILLWEWNVCCVCYNYIISHYLSICMQADLLPMMEYQNITIFRASSNVLCIYVNMSCMLFFGYMCVVKVFTLLKHYLCSLSCCVLNIWNRLVNIVKLPLQVSYLFVAWEGKQTIKQSF